jgi:branched-chain amino acid transport system permease protein
MNMDTFGQFFQLFITGITVGSIYAMVAVGFNMIYNATDVVNFAQGEFVMLGGMIMVSLHATLGMNMPLAFFFTVLIVTAAGIAFERITIHPLKKPTLITLILITIAVSFLFKGIAMFTWGKDSLSLPAFSGEKPILIWGAAIHPQTLWIIGFLVVLVVFLTYFFNFTMFGKALRATAINREAASLMGIDVKKMITFSFAMSAAIGAVAGLIITPITLIEYDRGAVFGIKGFCAAILGGIGNSGGAVVAGLIIGILESFGAGLLSSGYKDAMAFLVMLLILFLRPGGLLGKYEVE